MSVIPQRVSSHMALFSVQLKWSISVQLPLWCGERAGRSEPGSWKIISEGPRHVVFRQVLLGHWNLSPFANTALGLEGQGGEMGNGANQAPSTLLHTLVLSLKTTLHAWYSTSGSHLATSGPEEEDRRKVTVLLKLQPSELRCQPPPSLLLTTPSRIWYSGPRADRSRESCSWEMGLTSCLSPFNFLSR